MNTFALIKENNITRSITDEDIREKYNSTLLTCKEKFISEMITKSEGNKFIKKSDLEEFEQNETPLSKIFVLALKKRILKDKRLDMYRRKAMNMSYCFIGDIDYVIGLCEDIENAIPITGTNFDYILKELGEISLNSEHADAEIHMCGKCDILSPLKCEKAEYIKKTISEYSFITDGYQIFSVDEDKKTTMEKFIVRECRSFIHDNATVALSPISASEKRLQRQRQIRINRLKKI